MNVRRAATLLLAVAAGCAKDPDYKNRDGGSGDTGAVQSACPADASAEAPAIEVGGGAAPDGGLNCATSCDFAGGIGVGCATRFQYGINFAWDQFAGDFGGIGAGSGVRGLPFNYVIGQDDGRVELYIDRGADQAAANKRIFDRLHSQRKDIERDFGSELSWQRLDDKRGSRIAFVTPTGGYRAAE